MINPPDNAQGPDDPDPERDPEDDSDSERHQGSETPYLDDSDLDVDEDFLDEWVSSEASGYPIPEALHSEYSGEPFKQCTQCGGSLSQAFAYQIQKVFRGEEVLFELALCQSCSEGLGREISEESHEALSEFMQSLLTSHYASDACKSCGIPRYELVRYSRVALCQTEFLAYEMTLCETCEDAVQNKLSQETRDRHDDFIRDNFPGVPSELDLNPLKLF